MPLLPSQSGLSLPIPIGKLFSCIKPLSNPTLLTVEFIPFYPAMPLSFTMAFPPNPLLSSPQHRPALLLSPLLPLTLYRSPLPWRLIRLGPTFCIWFSPKTYIITLWIFWRILLASSSSPHFSILEPPVLPALIRLPQLSHRPLLFLTLI